MHIRRVRLQSFRRFTDLTLDLGEARPKLIMLCGPNGSGKSSLFDALRMPMTIQYGGWLNDVAYYLKAGVPHAFGEGFNPHQQVEITFDGPDQTTPVAQNALYVRSAYRNEAEFSSTQLQRATSPLEGPQVNRMIENDARVADNYQRLVGQTIASLYEGGDDDRTGREIRDRLIGQLRDVIKLVFPDLELVGPGDPLGGGTFTFRKGNSSGYQYKNLSGGEKAAFDLLLDLTAKQTTYDDTVFCIDEPEAHTNPRVQGPLLDAMVSLLPPESQLWLATHSVGMMKRARDLQEMDPDQVAFVDFEVDFDHPQRLVPAVVDRAFWRRTLSTAFGDMAELVAPARVLLCEGEPGGGARADFDAQCLRVIFADEHPDTEFLGVGNDQQVQSDARGIGRAVEALAPGTSVERLIDRDGRTSQEVAEIVASGTRVLGRRHLESYLLDDDVLEALCALRGLAEKWPELQTAKQEALANSTAAPRSNPSDDWKSCSGDVFNAARRILNLTTAGNSKDTFMRDTLAPLIRPGTPVYAELRSDVLGTT